MPLNGWRVVWVVAVYDCPMVAPDERHEYTVFRRHILQEDFTQLQYSMYAKHFPTMAHAESAVQRLSSVIQ